MRENDLNQTFHKFLLAWGAKDIETYRTMVQYTIYGMRDVARQTCSIVLLQVIDRVIQGHNGERDIGFTVLVDAVHGSNHSTEPVPSSSDEDRDLLSFPHRLWSEV